MKRTLRTAVVGTGVAAIVLGASASAFAATPPWQTGTGTGKQVKDANNIGNVGFYDASGNQITTGNAGTQFPFLRSDTGAFATSGTATALFCLPDPNTVEAGWSCSNGSGGNLYGGTNPAGLPGNKPTVKSTSNDDTIGNYAAYETTAIATSSDTGYYQVYEVRVTASGTPNKYASGDVQVTPNGSGGGTWTEVYGSQPATPTSVTLAGSKSGNQLSGTAETLTATVSPSGGVPGSVTFYDNNVAISGSATAISSGTTASYGPFTPADGSHSFTAIFTSNSSDYSVSPASNAVALNELTPVNTTTSNVTVTPGSGNAYSAQSVSATVTAASGTATPDGYFAFSDSVAGNLGTASVSGSGASATATLSNITSLGGGSHQITATYTSSSGLFNTSNAKSATFTLNNVGATPDPQTITVEVVPGSLTISTPYTPSNPFDLGNMSLNANSTALTASKAFGTTTAPANGVTITDTRTGGANWAASAASTDFGDPANDTISKTGLSLTSLQAVPVSATNHLQASNVSVTPITSFSASPQSFAQSTDATNGGTGTIYVIGTLGLTAPTSTKVGNYTATVTFTLI